MKISNIPASKVSFRKLIIGNSITKRVSEKKPSNFFMYEYDQVEQVLSMLNLNSKENIDVILNYNSKDGFYGQISGITRHIPTNMPRQCKISPDYKIISIFDEWLNAWNDFFSKEKSKISKIADNIINSPGEK